MLRSIKFYAKLVLSLICLNPKSINIDRNKDKWSREKKENYAHGLAHNWAKGRVKDSGVNIIVHGRENIPQDGNVLLVSNHQSNFDFAVLLSEIDIQFGFLAKIELGKIPLLRKWIEHINCLLIDRNDMRQQLKIILDGIGMLKNGYSLLVFPEGTRSKDGKVHEFKAGSFKLATKTKVPILPITLVGTADVIENNNSIIKPVTVEVYIHEPIHLEELEKEEIGKIHETVQAIVSGPIK